MYSSKIMRTLKENKIQIGDKIDATIKDKSYTGLLMPSTSESSADVMILKLDNGYNIGISHDGKTKISKIASSQRAAHEDQKIKHDPSKPTILVLHTGGTIASKVDYRTGGVIARFSPEDIVSSVPELGKIANIKTQKVFQMWSEDMEVQHWSMLAGHIAKEVKKGGIKGIIVGIGTDTLEYVSSALSFALQNLPIPVLIVGSQRSSDRPSSDAHMNLICAAHFIAKSDFKGIAVCMHENSSDDFCHVLEGHHLKKMHTSRRDTFRPMNKKPIARVNTAGHIEYISNDYYRGQGTFQLKNKFSPKVGLVKIYPGFRKEELDWHEKNSKALVIEGYAFGQMPINNLDKYTKHHSKLLEKIRKMAKKMPLVVASQRPYGATHMHVYSTSIDLINAGVIEAKTQAHVAYSKLCWVMGQTTNVENAKKMMQTDICGEILERIEDDTFLI